MPTPPIASSSKASTSAGPSHIGYNASFASLARFFRGGGRCRSPPSERCGDDVGCVDGSGQPDFTIEEEDGDEDGGIDEETLMWDAQTALIAHQPSLATELFTTAALPPYRSAAACLELGKLMKGTGLTTIPTSSAPSSSIKGKEKYHQSNSAALWGNESDSKPSTEDHSLSSTISTLFSSFSYPATVFSSSTFSTETLRTHHPSDLVSNRPFGQTDGRFRRTAHDVEKMGVAGGWLILGIGWVMESSRLVQSSNLAAEKPDISGQIDLARHHSQDDAYIRAGSNWAQDDILLISSKGKENLTGQSTRPNVPDRSRRDSSTSLDTSKHPSTADLSHAESGTTEAGSEESLESRMIVTPGETDSSRMKTHNFEVGVDPLRQLYDLLQALLHLYRHGHIQASDPVYLPPIVPAQLPNILRPMGDLQKRRNVWALGEVVAGRLLASELIRGQDGRLANTIRTDSRDKLRHSVMISAHYILSMTVRRSQQERHLQFIVSTDACGLSAADELVKSAAVQLSVDKNLPSGLPNRAHQAHKSDCYSPHASLGQRPPKRGHQRYPSNLSLGYYIRSRRSSTASTNSRQVSGILPTPIRSATSSTGLDAGQWTPTPTNSRHSSAVETLKRFNNIQATGRAKTLGTSRNPIKPDLFAADGEIVTARWTPRLDRLWRPEHKDHLRPVLSTPNLSFKRSGIRSSASSTPLRWTPRLDRLWRPEHKDHRRPVLSTPNLSFKRSGIRSSASSTPLRPSKPSSASLLCRNQTDIGSIDPRFAAAELASALTTHVCCSVCAVRGVHFPECRKCGMRFCSRECRVGGHGAGDGKRHVCGVWDAQKASKRASTGNVDAPFTSQVKAY